MNVRIDEDLYNQLRREEAESGMSLSSVMRLALSAGVEAVTASYRGWKGSESECPRPTAAWTRDS